MRKDSIRRNAINGVSRKPDLGLVFKFQQTHSRNRSRRSWEAPLFACVRNGSFACSSVQKPWHGDWVWFQRFFERGWCRGSWTPHFAKEITDQCISPVWNISSIGWSKTSKYYCNTSHPLFQSSRDFLFTSSSHIFSTSTWVMYSTRLQVKLHQLQHHQARLQHPATDLQLIGKRAMQRGSLCIWPSGEYFLAIQDKE